MNLVKVNATMMKVSVLVLIVALLGGVSAGFVNTVSGAPYLTNQKWIRNLGGQGKTYLMPLAGDLDGDGDMEVVIVGGSSDGGFDGSIFVLNGATGATLWQASPQQMGWATGVGMHTCAEVADLDNDGRMEIIVAAEGATFALRFNGTTSVFSMTLYWSNPDAIGRQNYFVVADVDGDGFKEVIVNSNSTPYAKPDHHNST